MSGLSDYRYAPEAAPAPECERCGESLWGTIQAEVIEKGNTEPVVVHEGCVVPTDTVLRLVHDDESTDHKD
jgi:hypothetical protein